MLKSKYLKKNIIILTIILIIFILSFLTYNPKNPVIDKYDKNINKNYSMINKSDKNTNKNFENLIKKSDYLNFTVNYDILLRGSYKDPSVKAPDGKVTLYHKELGEIYSQNIDLRGLHWPNFFVRYEERWLYDLQEVIEKNYHNFEVSYVGEKEYLKETTECFSIKGILKNTSVLLKHCYNSNGIMLYQDLSVEGGGAELIASSYKLELDS